MKQYKLALCDGEEVYCRRLDEYLRDNLNLSFEIFSFTDTKLLEEFTDHNPISLLLIAESSFYKLSPEQLKKKFKNIIVLNEQQTSFLCEEKASDGMNIIHVNKYQSASSIVGEILSFCTNTQEDFEGLGTTAFSARSRLIGFYTPLSRSGQTTLAIELAKYLSQKGRTLFLSFETFSSLAYMLEEQIQEDLTDLLYYADCEKNKFGLYLERIRRSRENVDFIAPAQTSLQLKDIDLDRFRNLYELISKDAGYDYVVLDMTDYPSGFFDILRMCDDVITIKRNGPKDNYQLGIYDEVLRQNGYEDVFLKTNKCVVPDLRDQGAYNSLVASLTESGALADANS